MRLSLIMCFWRSRHRTSILTLRRDVSPDGSRPMQIIFEPLDKALSSGPVGWQTLPYRRPDAGMSFSQLLFRAIGVPEAISDGSSNITMHQVLRLLYVDQMTPVQRIFRAENFDTWQTRQAVGDLMCGIGGYDLYDSQIRIRELSRTHDEVSTRLRNLMSVAASYGDQILPEHIQAAIAKLSGDRDRLLVDLKILLNTEETPNQQMDDAAILRKEIQREYAQARKQVMEFEDRIETLRYEIEDAEQFLVHLQKSLDDFNDAHVTFSSLGHVRFEFCPVCFAPTKAASDDHHCHLCGAETIEEHDDSKGTRCTPRYRNAVAGVACAPGRAADRIQGFERQTSHCPIKDEEGYYFQSDCPRRRTVRKRGCCCGAKP